MTLYEIMEAIGALDNEEGMEAKEAMNMDVEFFTKDSEAMTLLSVYEYKGKIILNVGTERIEKDYKKSYGEMH
jgi:hypothetical protein